MELHGSTSPINSTCPQFSAIPPIELDAASASADLAGLVPETHHSTTCFFHHAVSTIFVQPGQRTSAFEEKCMNMNKGRQMRATS